MKKKIFITLILCFFIFILISGRIFKNISFENGTIPVQIDSLSTYIENDDWDTALYAFTSLNTDWEKLIKIIQFSCERNEIHALSVSLARVNTSINNKDKNNALLDLSQAKEYWTYLCY